MKKLNVLLVCGAGFSSGFMAQNLRKAAKEKEIEMSVLAKSETAIEDYIDEIDAVMVGPHMAYVIADAQELCDEYGVTLILMKGDYYKNLDGVGCLDHLLEELKKEGKI